MSASIALRRLPIGAEPRARGAHFRVWAPARRRVEVILEGSANARTASRLESEPGGYFSGMVDGAEVDTLYRFQLDSDSVLYPDPASRFQPEGPHGPSRIVDSAAFDWTDRAWRGVPRERQVIYELHVGTFTHEGTWQAAARELATLAETGITTIELMPVAEFPGRFGWGYDGVDLFAPTRCYGSPDEFRTFVDRAHGMGLAVILDVVYNHLGPDGCYLGAFSRDYFTDRYENEWGAALNFDGENSAAVREFFTSNAANWIEEFHLDGLRLDATQQIFDSSAEHIIAAITRAVRTAGGARSTFVVCENEPQDRKLIDPPERGGDGADALWNDDFHHAAMVAVTGRSEAYYSDYLGTPQELVSSVRHGFLYQGQYYEWQKKRRGSPTLGLPPAALVNYLQNHDQVANSARGERLHQITSPGRYRAITALLLLGPATPMLFQGQEFASSSPFLFFADHNPELAIKVRQGRAEFLSQFASAATDEIRQALARPDATHTFERCKLDRAERERRPEAYALHRDLLRLRRDDPVFSSPRTGGVDGAVLGVEAFVLRYFGGNGEDRLLIVNLGRDLRLHVVAEPLLAPPENRRWRVLWSSESACYGGRGTPPSEIGEWTIHGHAAVVLAPGSITGSTGGSG